MSAKFNVFWLLLFSCQWSSAQEVYFTNLSRYLKVVSGTIGHAKCGADLNGDGLDDITRVSKKGIYLDLQQKNGKFRQHFFPLANLNPPVWSTCAGDINNDGVNDLFFGGESRLTFLKSSLNNAPYFLRQVMSQDIFPQRNNFFDIDNDGDLDGFVCNDVGKPLVFKNDGHGNMEADQNMISLSPLAGNYSSIWTDYNNDGFTDLYITKCFANTTLGDPRRINLLYHNNGNGTFTEKAKLAGMDDGAQSWSTAFEDFDNDGDFDAFIINHDIANRLYRNNGNETFTDVIQASGIDALDLGAWENTTGDFNNDGFIDIISELKNNLYLNKGDLTFTGQNLPFSPGAIGDFNNDGFLDATYRNELWINNGNNNHWVKIHLHGIQSNRNGIGARIEIFGPWGKQIRELRSGQSYSPMNTLDVHFGLGANKIIDKLIVRWPSGTITEMYNLRADSTYTIPEAACIIEPLNITLQGDSTLCPDQTTLLLAPQGFNNYLWSNGSTSPSLLVDQPGFYNVIYTNDTLCKGISPLIEISKSDGLRPEITLLEGDTYACEGQGITLHSSAGPLSNWSTGAVHLTDLSVMESGAYWISIDSVCGPGKLVSDTINIDILPLPLPKLESIAYLSNDSVLVKLNGENCLWYNGWGDVIDTSCDKIFYPVIKDTAFYVSSTHNYSGKIFTSGKEDTSGFSFPFPQNVGLHFTLYRPITLLSLDMYLFSLQDAGERTIQLLDEKGQVVKQLMVNLKDLKNTVYPNFHIGRGSYSLHCSESYQLMTAGAIDYPFSIGTSGSIDSCDVGLNFYPYFYNWQIREEDVACSSELLRIDLKPSSIETINTSLEIELFPIPANDLLTIKRKNNNTTFAYTIYAMDGRILQTSDQIYTKDDSIDISALENGLYFISIQLDASFVVRKFIVHK